jgi:hypothetical protein
MIVKVLYLIKDLFICSIRKKKERTNDVLAKLKRKKKKEHAYMYRYYYHLLLRLCSFKMNELVDKTTTLMDRLMQSK